MFAHFGLVVFGIVIKDALVDALVVGQQEGLLSATRQVVQLLCDFLRNAFLGIPSIIVI